MTDHGYGAREHYDYVTDAWTLLLGDDLHYGVFESPDEPLPTATARLTQLMVAAMHLDDGLEVLDVGCGTGHAACQLAADHGTRVLGITPSKVGVERATIRASQLGLSDRVRFESRDGMDNGLPDASADRVWVLESSHLMRDRDRLISESARVLRPRGRVALCDLMLQRPMSFAEVRRLHQPLGVLREAFGAARLESRSEYENRFAQHGIAVDTSIDLTAQTQRTFTRWRENATRHREVVVEQLGEVGLSRFQESCDILEGFWQDGTIGYGLVAGAVA